MCSRFVIAMSKLNMTTAEISRELGYCNSNTIAKLKQGEAFVDVDRLRLLAALRTPSGKRIDLNWLITGQGSAESDEI